MECMRTSFFSNNFKGAISKYKAVLHRNGYDFEDFFYGFMEAPLSEPFFKRWNKMLSRTDSLMLCGKLGVDFFCTSESLIAICKYEN